MTGSENVENSADIPKAERELVLSLRQQTTSKPLKRVLNAYLSGAMSDELFSAVTNLINAPNLNVGAKNVFLKTLSSSQQRRIVKMIADEYSEADELRLKSVLKLYREASIIEDLFATRANRDDFETERFSRAYERAAAISVWGGSIRWRCYVLMKCAVLASRLDGDFVECGTDRGGTALGVVEYVGRDAFANRKLYLFDTFEGLDDSQVTTREAELSLRKDSRYPPVYEQVKKTFAKDDFVKIVKGSVPGTLEAFEGGDVAYLHIDMNCAAPECAALEFFWPHLVQGAPVIFDDYGFPLHRVQKEELDALTAKYETSIITLPTGQGLMWKT